MPSHMQAVLLFCSDNLMKCVIISHTNDLLITKCENHNYKEEKLDSA